MSLARGGGMRCKVPERIDSRHISIRPIEIKDASEIIKCLSIASSIPANLVFFANGVPTLKQEVDWIRATLKRMKSDAELVFAVTSCDDEHCIGTVGLHEIDWKNRNARIGIMIFNEIYRGHGLAEEIISCIHQWIFQNLVWNKVYMNFRTDNKKMRHIAKKLKYRRVGVLKQEYYWRGKWVDFIRYELTSERYYGCA